MLDKNYWNQRYIDQKAGWDVGYAVPPLCEYFDQLSNKNINILVPGAGNAYEVEYLFNNGFKNTFLLDFATEPIQNFLKRCPTFPSKNIIIEDFFTHQKQYDLIIEHTFLTSFQKHIRPEYAKKLNKLLKPGGKLVGVLFNHEFDFDGPPYGGTSEEYKNLFSPYFEFKIFETAYNSIKPRKDRELFLVLTKK